MGLYLPGTAGGNGQYLITNSAPVSAYPFTMGGWFNPAATNKTYDLIFLKNSGSNYAGIYLNPSGSSPVIGATINDAQTALSSSTFTANNWHHAAGVFTSSTSRQAFLNGAGGTVNTGSQSFSVPSQTMIGGFLEGTNVYGSVSGFLAEIFVYNVALSANEIKALANRVSPLRIRPSNLIAYWPLYGRSSTEPNLKGSLYSLTANGDPLPSQDKHPPIMRPWQGPSPTIIYPPVAPSGRTKVWNGTSWVLKPTKVWNGTSWV